VGVQQHTGRKLASKAPKRSLGGITAISVSGYKSLHGEQRIEIRPLTILAGANSSGKSSIMQPLLLLKQTLEAQFDPGDLWLDGPNVRFSSVDQLLSHVHGPRPSQRFAVGLEMAGQPTVKLTFGKHAGPGLAIESMLYGSHTIYPGMPPEEARRAVPQQILERYGIPADVETRWQVVPRRCFLDLVEYSSPPVYGGVSLTGSVAAYVSDTIHLPGNRGNRERAYKTTAVGRRFPGTFENYVASIISQWQADSNGRAHETSPSGAQKLIRLGKALEELGLTWKVQARQVDDSSVELRVGRLPHGKSGEAHDLVSIADVGFGVSQALPVLVALLVAEPGGLLYIEEPELHLHPRAQRRLAVVLAEAAKRGVRVVAETHSSLLLRGIQILVAKGRLSRDLVKLHWFKRSKDGATEVHSADLDGQGAYGQDWPEDFDDVTLDTEAEYLDAAERRSA
jgi:predicted ATPase